MCYKRLQQPGLNKRASPPQKEAKTMISDEENGRTAPGDNDTNVKTVMIVEDEALTAMMLQHNIELFGWRVVAVEDTGRGAIESARRHHPDAILMDICLADEIDGIEAARIINNGIHIIFHTAYADEKTRSRAMAIHPEAYLEKPADDSRLQQVLTSTLAC